MSLSEECVKNKDRRKYNKISMQYLKEFDQIENNGEDGENKRSQSCAYTEKNKTFNDIDESDRKLTRKIRKKSESLINFIKSVKKSSNSHQSNKKRMSNDVSVTTDKPLEREIPLHRVVEFMKKASACKKRKRNLKLPKKIKEKSESLTDYIASTDRPSTSYQSTESDKARDDRNADCLKRKNNDHKSDVPSNENHGKRYICFFESIKFDEDWKKNYKCL